MGDVFEAFLQKNRIKIITGSVSCASSCGKSVRIHMERNFGDQFFKFMDILIFAFLELNMYKFIKIVRLFLFLNLFM